MKIQCKRVYDPAEKNDGYRVLVDRLWPRGVKKTDLIFNEWNKALTPSSDLRKAFHAELIDFTHFSEQYRAELALQQTLTLLYAAKNTQQNHALVLAEWIRQC